MRLVLLLLALLLPTAAAAADWGGIEPGVSTVEQVRARYGAPSRETRPKVEGYDTMHWVYEGARAPAGLERMTVDFGFLLPTGYRPDVVRVFVLEPRPNVFGRNTVMQGWGLPDGVTKNQDGTSTLVWKNGLLATFDKEDRSAVSLVFSVPQPLSIGGGAPPAAPPPPAAAPKR